MHTSRWWERYRATREHRRPQQLFHAALEVVTHATPYVIELAPAWGSGSGYRGVVATGPVGFGCLGRSRIFRYEVRCWPNGVIPDRTFAVEPGLRFSLTDTSAEHLVHTVAKVPTFVWGRTVPGTDDMWNSNSVIAWLLLTAHVDASRIAPPEGGRAPGWRAGIVAAQRG